MGVFDGIISGPINLSDPYYCLGVGQYNGWWDLGYINSNAHGKTNMWSKKKPYRYDSPNELTDAQIKTTNYGLSIPSPVNDYTVAITKPWGYLAPDIATDWKRLTDWIGYNHNAMPIIDGIGNFSFRFASSPKIIQFPINRGGSDQIGFDDLTNTEFVNYYLGIAIRHPSTGAIFVKTAVNTISHNDTEISLNESDPFFRDFKNSQSAPYQIIAVNTKISTMIQVTSLYKYITLPFKSANDAKGNIDIFIGMGLISIPEGISTSFGNNVFMSFDSFSDATPEGEGAYFGLIANGAIYIKFEVINNSDEDVTLQNKFTVAANPTFTGTNDGSNPFPAKMYVNKLEVQSTIIPKNGGSIKVVLGDTNIMNRRNGDVYAMQPGKKYVELTWKYNNAYSEFATSPVRMEYK